MGSIKDTDRLLNWIKRYPGWWYLICTPGDEHMDLDMMQQLIRRLEKESFYELIFVLLMVHRDAPHYERFFCLFTTRFFGQTLGWRTKTDCKGHARTF